MEMLKIWAPAAGDAGEMEWFMSLNEVSVKKNIKNSLSADASNSN